MSLVLILFAGTRLAPHLPTTSYFDVVLAAAAIYSLLALAATWRTRDAPGPHNLTLAVDLLLITILAYGSGRAFPQIRAAFIVVPMAAAIHLNPKRTAATSIIASAAYVFVALLHPVRQPLPVVAVLAHSTFVLWSGAAAVVMSTLRDRRQRRIVDLAHARRLLVAQTVESEERVRKSISSALHDHVIQGLLSARHDLEDARTGDKSALGSAQHAIELALKHLRNTIEDLDPYLLDHLDLASALRAVADREARHAGYQLEVNVQPATSGMHDALIASVARELLSNATKHAHASNVRLDLKRCDDRIALEITDDGRGFTHAQALTAARTGHIGLAAVRERIEAAGGSLQIDSTPGRGSRLRCVLPTRPTATHLVCSPPKFHEQRDNLK